MPTFARDTFSLFTVTHMENPGQCWPSFWVSGLGGCPSYLLPSVAGAAGTAELECYNSSVRGANIFDCNVSLMWLIPAPWFVVVCEGGGNTDPQFNITIKNHRAGDGWIFCIARVV